MAVLVLGGCTSGGAPGAENVIDQTEKAEELTDELEERNEELETQP